MENGGLDINKESTLLQDRQGSAGQGLAEQQPGEQQPGIGIHGRAALVGEDQVGRLEYRVVFYLLLKWDRLI